MRPQPTRPLSRAHLTRLRARSIASALRLIALCLIAQSLAAHNVTLASPTLEALCVRRRGPALIDREERVTLTQRYGSWTLRVYTERALGFGSEAALSLVTAQEAREVMSATLRGLKSLPQPPLSQPHDEASFERCPPLSNRPPHDGVDVWVSLLERPLEEPQGGAQGGERPARWLTWRLHDPDRDLNPATALALAPFQALRRTLSPRAHPHDLLLTAEERGRLLVKLPRPTRLLIDGVDCGLLGVEPLAVTPGRHTITLYPLSPPYGPFQYRGVEVERGKLTRLSLDLD